MGVDRADDGTENVETTSSADQSPPPRDRPGADGYPSRADSRNRAAATNNSTAAPKETRGETESPGQAADAADERETPGDAGNPVDTGESAGPSSIPDAPDQDVASVDRSSEPEAVSAGDTEVENRGNAETAPESFTMAPDDEDGSEEAQQEAGPWKYDLSVHDVPLEEFLDRTAGDYRRPDERNAVTDDLPDEGPGWVERRSDLPSGEELRDMDSDKLSRFDKMRKSAFKKADDILDNSKEYINSGHDALNRPPIGSHTQVRQAGPEFTDAAHHSATIGDLMTGVLVAGFLLGEGGRHIYRELARKGDDHDGHR